MKIDRYTFRTYDEEYNYAGRISLEIEKTLEELELDTVNKEFLITVEIQEI